MRMRPSYLVLMAVAATLGCRSGGGRVVRGPGAAPAPEFVQAFVGQQRILLHRGDEAKLTLDRKELAKIAGDCDAAVGVKTASFEGGVLRLGLEYFGQPTLELKRGPRGKKGPCAATVPAIALVLSGFRPDEGAAAVEADLGKILPIPEAYLVAHGVSFDLAPTADPKSGASALPDATSEERSLGRQVTSWPKKVLTVDPAFYDPSRKVHHEAEVELVALIGADGRAHHTAVRTALSEEHEAFVKRVLSLWRFEPARQKDQPVAARISLRAVFRIY